MATCVSSSSAVAQSSAEFNATRVDSSSHAPTFSPLPKLPKFTAAADDGVEGERGLLLKESQVHCDEGNRRGGSRFVAGLHFRRLCLQTLEAAVATKAVKDELDKLMEQGRTKLWSSTANLSRRNTFMTELTRLGIKNAEELAIPSVRNDAAFLATVVGVTSVVAVAAGQLPGDWPYLLHALSCGLSLAGGARRGVRRAGVVPSDD